ncbi:paralemmin 1a isoform X4 [Trematomus bernacchii]|uniref:paralemmin 1a isoform X4 n=1 Tax=Trematomus bernacchii TaxID=40690 RepID=UPI00146EFC7D|nr:paralemmin 1a isoform X4 [Trematomus bernacchii]
MEVGEAQDRQLLLAEKRKWQTEIENKKRQLEDDKRALQHLKSKALRERWLLEGAAPGPEQDDRRKQLQLDEDKTRSLEENICRLEEELLSLENGGVCETITHTTVSSGSVKDVEVKVHSVPKQDEDQIIQEVKVHKSPRMNKPREETEEMKRVVHEMNGDDGVQLLSFSQVEELIFKADEASVVSHTGDTVTSLPTAEVQEEEEEEEEEEKEEEEVQEPVEIPGVEAQPIVEVNVEEASAENPVTMVFMGYQSVEDEDETKKVLGVQGSVKAELVLIGDGKTSPDEAKTPTLPPPASPKPTSASPAETPAKTPVFTDLPPANKPQEEATMTPSNGGTPGETSEVQEMKKEKQPCKCCSIM